MPVSNRLLNGKMNLDVSNYEMPASDFAYALNITRDAEFNNQDKVVSNIRGNSSVSYTLPAGTNKCIGSFADVVRNSVYYFVWNSNGKNSFLYFDAGRNIIVKIIEDLTDTGGVGVLLFNPSKRINHVDIIYRDDDGDLVLWTDGNSTPKCANVTRLLNAEYGVLKSAFIETAKKPFLTSPLCTYGTDATRDSNALRRKLFQFSSRPVFKDFQKATFSTYSKIPLPVGYYGSDNDVETTKNNFITIVVETGDVDVAKIELFMRFNNGDIWSDFLQIASIDKEQLSIPSNSTYSFLFYNDGIYPPVPITDAIRLFDWVPQLADGQGLADGTYPIYASITEGYDNIPITDLDVTITAANHTNIPPDTNPPAITYTIAGTIYTFVVTGTVPVGTIYTVGAYVNYAFPTPPATITMAQYTSILGDTPTTVATAMYNYIVAHTPTLAGGHSGPNFLADLPSGSFIAHIDINTPSPGGSTIATEKTWLPQCNYVMGLVYVDEQNRDIPGVTTFSNPVDSANDFLVTTPALTFDGSNNIQTAVISASINHTPPANAAGYYWVRRRMNYGTFLFYETCDYQDGGTDNPDHLFFCLANVDAFKAANSQFVYGTAPITSESRIKIIAGVTASAYNGSVWNQDYEILGVETRTLTGGSSPTDDKPFIKVKKPAATISPFYQQNMLVMIYTPMANPITETDSVFYEWGETYGIYEIAGVKYHRGMDQDQTASQPATFTWPEGDVYFRKRTMYRQLLSFPASDADTVSVLDYGFSDYFQSGVNDNGRAQVVEVNAKRQYNPALVRHGGSFESGTTINEINKFSFENFIEGTRDRGAIRKVFIDKKRAYLFQQFDVGVMPIFTQIIKDTSGNPLDADSDTLLNTIQYPYEGKFGIGDVPESFAFGKGAKYFVDSNRGVVCRLSQDGIIPISILYQCNSFFVANLAAYGKGLDNGVAAPGQPYTGNPTVYGAFSAYTNKYIVALEEINRYANSNGVITGQAAASNDILLAFGGLVYPDVTIILQITAANGNALNVSYVTVAGDTLTSVRDNLQTEINTAPGALFSSTSGTTTELAPLPFNAAGYPTVQIHNHLNSIVSVTVVQLGALILHQDAKTLSFVESRGVDEGFESYLSYLPENIVCLNNLLISFQKGVLWRHDSTTYNNFYGVQYESIVVPVFNDSKEIKKTFERLSYRSNKIWTSDQLNDIQTSLTNPQTGLVQSSKLRSFDYEVDEGVTFAALLRDANSNNDPLEGLYNGDYLTGDFIIVRLRLLSAEYGFLFLVHLGWNPSYKIS